MSSAPSVWVHLIIKNLTKNRELKIEYAYVTNGKFYDANDKWNEIGREEVEKQSAKSREQINVASCVSDDGSDSIIGNISITDGTTQVAYIEWTCGGDCGDGDLGVECTDDNYIVAFSGYKSCNANLGTITLQIVHLPDIQY